MNHRRGTIPGDLLTAIAALEISDEATAREVAAMLGLAQRPRRAPTATVTPPVTPGHQLAPGEPTVVVPAAADIAEAGRREPQPSRMQEPVRRRPRPRAAGRAPGPTAVRPTVAALPDRPLPSSLIRLAAGTGPPEARSTSGEAGSGPATALPSGTTTRVPAPAYLPPWQTRWAPGIVFAAAASMGTTSRLDIRRAVRAAERGAALHRFPGRRRLTTRMGVHLLVDMSDALRPFSADRQWFIRMVRRVVGASVQLVRFRSSPATGTVVQPLAPGSRYDPPHPGVPVLIFSDLGLRPAPSRAWGTVPRGWFHFLAALPSESPVTVVTPHLASGYPKALRRRVTLVPMHQRLTLQQVLGARPHSTWDHDR